jgi:preprotein translocase subunit SecA
MRELERRVVLSVVDRKWRDHLYEMDYLKEGIGLRAMAQRDPLVEYQREGYVMFQQMMGAIREETVGFMFNLEVQVEANADHTEVDAKGLDDHPDRGTLTYIAPSEDGAAQVSQGPAELQRPANPQAPTGEQKPKDGKGSSFFKS